MKKTASGFTTFSSHERGFTLIELLITISIIAILSAIGLVAYSSVMKQGRDAKRQADLRSIQSALNQYFIDQGFYPYATGFNPSGFNNGLDDLLAGSFSGAFTNLVGNPSNPLPTVTKTYMSSLPQDPSDPTGTHRYKYEARPASCDNLTTNKCTGYCLYANLENSNPGRPAVCTNRGYDFAITPP